MSTQIAVRLPDELVDYIDGLVEERTVKSRAEFVATAIKREQRRRQAEADIAILQRADANDLDALVEFQREHLPQFD